MNTACPVLLNYGSTLNYYLSWI